MKDCVQVDKNKNVKYFSARGRIGRLRYLIDGILIPVVGFIVISFVLGLAVPNMNHNPDFMWMYFVSLFLLSIIFGLGYLYATAKRLHDLGLSCWWLFLFWIPYLNFVLILLLLIIKGNEGGNKYDICTS